MLRRGEVKRIEKIKPVFLIILAQTLLTLCFGIAAYSISAGDRIPPGVNIGGVKVGGLREDEALAELERHYGAFIKNGAITIKFDEKYFDIKFSELEAVLDSGLSLDRALGENGKYLLNRLGAEFGIPPQRTGKPAFSVNEGKLRMELEKLSVHIDSPPVDADIFLREGELIKSQEKQGWRLELKNAVNRLKKELQAYSGEAVVFDASNDYEVKTERPAVTLKELEDAETVISSGTLEIKAPRLMAPAATAAAAINKAALASGDGGPSEAAFSFNEYLEKQGSLKNEVDEGYNLVASALYIAVLEAGIGKGHITRAHHPVIPEYAPPGLDVFVKGGDYDFKFENPFKSRLFILADVNPDSVRISLVGKKAEAADSGKIETRIVRRIEPPVIQEESGELSEGERIVVSNGKEGAEVEVLRNGDLLYTDTYEAVHAVVKVGPGTTGEHAGEK